MIMIHQPEKNKRSKIFSIFFVFFLINLVKVVGNFGEVAASVFQASIDFAGLGGELMSGKFMNCEQVIVFDNGLTWEKVC